MTIISVNPATCISGGHGVGLKSLHPPPPKPSSQGASPAAVWVVWPGNEGMIPRGTAGVHGGEARRRENREAMLCAGTAFGGQGGHAGCFYGDFSGLESTLSRAALTRTNV